MNRPAKPDAHARALPSWWRQPGESWHDWDKRRRAENTAALEARNADRPKPLTPLRSGLLDLATGVGTYDANGEPKGSGLWW